ncbi:MAG: ADP-ribosylation factor-like protein, partial [Promethearchaeota archaeon]
MGALSSIFGKHMAAKITFVGLSNAGKTTLLTRLKGEVDIETSATMGMNVEIEGRVQEKRNPVWVPGAP